MFDYVLEGENKSLRVIKKKITPLAVERLPLLDLNLPSMWWKGSALFNQSDAYALMDYCALKNIAILSAEAFKFDGKEVTSTVSYTADFAELHDRYGLALFSEYSIDSSKIFCALFKAKKDVFFQFAISESIALS
jgi:hypothetical protein